MKFLRISGNNKKGYFLCEEKSRHHIAIKKKFQGIEMRRKQRNISSPQVILTDIM